MTQDEIIELAKQAEILEKGDEWVFDMSNALALTVNQKQLEAFAKLVAEKQQRAWVGLTVKEANELWESTDSDWELMKRVEVKLKEKNT